MSSRQRGIIALAAALVLLETTAWIGWWISSSPDPVGAATVVAAYFAAVAVTGPLLWAVFLWWWKRRPASQARRREQAPAGFWLNAILVLAVLAPVALGAVVLAEAPVSDECSLNRPNIPAVAFEYEVDFSNSHTVSISARVWDLPPADGDRARVWVSAIGMDGKLLENFTGYVDDMTSSNDNEGGDNTWRWDTGSAPIKEVRITAGRFDRPTRHAEEFCTRNVDNFYT